MTEIPIIKIMICQWIGYFYVIGTTVMKELKPCSKICSKISDLKIIEDIGVFRTLSLLRKKLKAKRTFLQSIFNMVIITLKI